MQYLHFYPSSNLHEIVKYYWIVQGSLDTPLTQSIIPDGQVDAIFNFGGRCSKLFNGHEEWLHDRFTTGHLTSHMQLKFYDQIGILGIRFRDEAAKHIYGVDAHELSDTELSIVDLWGKESVLLEEQLMDVLNKGQYTSAIEIIESYFALRFYASYEKDTVLSFSLNLVHASKGRLSMQELSTKTGYSERYLQKMFHEKRGISFQRLNKIARFQSFLTLLSDPGKQNLTGLSYEAGYFDQAHLVRDCRTFTGMTPTEYLRSDNRFADFLTAL
jgi:AraC-like DNA-binding protein